MSISAAAMQESGSGKAAASSAADEELKRELSVLRAVVGVVSAPPMLRGEEKFIYLLS